MLPRLQAEEELEHVSSVGVGTAHVKKSDADKYMRELKARASGERKQKTSSIEDLRKMGIPVKRTAKKKETPNA